MSRCRQLTRWSAWAKVEHRSNGARFPGGRWFLMIFGFQVCIADLTDRLPLPVGVQALACAPLWALQRYSPSSMGWVTEAPTIAEGVRGSFPLRGDASLDMLKQFGSRMSAVDEKDILPGRDRLADLGFSVEPTSALDW